MVTLQSTEKLKIGLTSQITEKHNTGHDLSQPANQTQDKPCDSNGSWLWEMCATSLSIVGTALLVCFLINIHGMLYEKWEYIISPNTAVAVIVAITKAALLAPVSAGLSQLKWNTYRRPSPLIHMQALDQASRGPWGAMELLVLTMKNSKPNHLWLTGALVTILALAIDPFAQQILFFPSREVRSLNSTASIQVARIYDLPGGGWDAGARDAIDNPLHPSILSSIMGGITQTHVPLRPICTSPKCKYPSFVTLGICSQCEDVTGLAHQSCQGEASFESGAAPEFPKCQYKTPGGFKFELEMFDVVTLFSWTAKQTTVYLDHWSSRTKYYDPLFDIQSPIVAFIAVNQSQAVYYTLQNKTVPPPRPSMTECAMFYCEKEYAKSSYVAHNTTSHLMHITQTQRLFPRIGYNSVFFDAPEGKNTLASNSSYRIDRDGIFKPLENVLNSILNTTQSNGHPPGDWSVTQILRYSDLGKLLDSMSVSITDTLRANSQDASIAGEAFKFETLIQVRWPWVILPICVVIGSVIFFLITVIESRQQHAILWKASVIPLLVSKVKTAPGHDMSSVRDVDEMHRIAKMINAEICDNEGSLVFAEQ